MLQLEKVRKCNICFGRSQTQATKVQSFPTKSFLVTEQGVTTDPASIEQFQTRQFLTEGQMLRVSDYNMQ